jgi:hypothetical protein
MDKIMNKKKIYGRCKKTYLSVAKLWTLYARKIIPILVYTPRLVIS